MLQQPLSVALCTRISCAHSGVGATDEKQQHILLMQLKVVSKSVALFTLLLVMLVRKSQRSVLHDFVATACFCASHLLLHADVSSGKASPRRRPPPPPQGGQSAIARTSSVVPTSPTRAPVGSVLPEGGQQQQQQTASPLAGQKASLSLSQLLTT